jgi:hypothetical protein
MNAPKGYYFLAEGETVHHGDLVLQRNECLRRPFGYGHVVGANEKNRYVRPCVTDSRKTKK